MKLLDIIVDMKYQIKKFALQTGFKIDNLHYADFCGFFITLIWKLFNKVN